MPFVARCVRCGHIETALTRDMLNVCIEGHDLDSHGYHDKDLWIVAVISNADYYIIQRLSKLPAFWNTLRTKAHKIPRFSG